MILYSLNMKVLKDLLYTIKREEPAYLLNIYYMVSNVLDARNKKSWKSKAHTITGKRQK